MPLDPLRYTSYGLLAQDAQFANRADNSIKYTGNFGNLTITGMYSAGYDATIANGSEVPGNPRIGQEVSVPARRIRSASSVWCWPTTSVEVLRRLPGNLERRYATGLLWTDSPFTATAGYRFLQRR